MIKNKQSLRSLIAFLVTWSFVVLTVTGIVLYIVPHGRVAYWVHWSLAGMGRDQWGWVHMMFGGVFIVTGVTHLVFNWKPFKKYLTERTRGGLHIKQELVVSLALTVAILAVAALNLPPASWVIDWNSRIKGAWVTSPELEPPFGHAEAVPMTVLAMRLNLDLEPALAALDAQGIRFESERDSLETIARANGTTPMSVYAIIRQFEKSPPPAPVSGLTPDAVEARYSGTGIGRKRLGDLIGESGLDEPVALKRLAEAGITAQPGESLREIAGRLGLTPIEVLKALLVAGYRPRP